MRGGTHLDSFGLLSAPAEAVDVEARAGPALAVGADAAFVAFL